MERMKEKKEGPALCDKQFILVPVRASAAPLPTQHPTNPSRKAAKDGLSPWAPTPTRDPEEASGPSRA